MPIYLLVDPIWPSSKLLVLALFVVAELRNITFLPLYEFYCFLSTYHIWVATFKASKPFSCLVPMRRVALRCQSANRHAERGPWNWPMAGYARCRVHHQLCGMALCNVGAKLRHGKSRSGARTWPESHRHEAKSVPRVGSLVEDPLTCHAFPYSHPPTHSTLPIIIRSHLALTF